MKKLYNITYDGTYTNITIVFCSLERYNVLVDEDDYYKSLHQAKQIAIKYCRDIRDQWNYAIGQLKLIKESELDYRRLE